MKKMLQTATAGAAALALVPTSALAQTATDPLAELTTGGTEKITALGTLGAALAIVVIGVKVVPAALKWVLAFINK